MSSYRFTVGAIFIVRRVGVAVLSVKRNLKSFREPMIPCQNLVCDRFVGKTVPA